MSSCFSLLLVLGFLPSFVLSTISVLTYNIRHGEGRDSVIDLPRIASIISQTKPDIVALQEVDYETSRSTGVHQAQQLANLTENMAYFFSSAMPYSNGDYGDAILWNTKRFAVNGIDSLQLAKGNEQRQACCVTLLRLTSEPSFSFQFCSTHLSLVDSVQHAEAEFIVAHVGLNAATQHPILFAGDFNAHPKSETLSTLLSVFETTTPKEIVTFPGSNSQIDYVLMKGNGKSSFGVEKAEAITGKVAYEASDHYALHVVLNEK